MQQNSKCMLCGDRDETINHEWSKLTKKEVQDEVQLSAKGGPLGILQAI